MSDEQARVSQLGAWLCRHGLHRWRLKRCFYTPPASGIELEYLGTVCRRCGAEKRPTWAPTREELFNDG